MTESLRDSAKNLIRYAEGPGGRHVMGEVNPDKTISLYPAAWPADNPGTPDDEAANAIANTIAHEGGHSYGVTYPTSEAYKDPYGHVDPDHSGDPGTLMARETDTSQREFDSTAAQNYQSSRLH